MNERIFQLWLPAAVAIVLGVVGLCGPRTATVKADEGSVAAAVPTTAEAVGAARAELSERMAQAEQALGSALSGSDRAHSERLVAGLKDIDLLWQQVLGALERGQALGEELEGLERDPQTLGGAVIVGDKGYSFRTFDRLCNELDAAGAKGLVVEAQLVTAEESLREAKGRMDQAQRARRAAKEAVDTTQDPAAAGPAAAALELAVLDAERTGVLVEMRRLELENQRRAVRLYQRRSELLAQTVERVRGQVRFRSDDLREVLAELEKREFEVGRELERAKVNLEYIQDRWFAARQRSDAAAGDDAAAVAEVEAKRLARQGRQAQVRSLTKALERLARMKLAWDRRYQVARGSATSQSKSQWEQESRQVVEQLERDARLPQARLAELREDMATVGRRIGDADDVDGKVMRWLEQQRREVQFEVDVWERDRVGIDEARGLEQKLASELGARSVSIGQRISWLWERVRAVWGFELTTVDDRPITVGKIVLGLMLLVLGVWVSRLISAVVGRRVLVRLGMNAGAAAAIQTVAFYVLVLSFGLFALHLVNVPLGVFTVLGGAVAIGVGFGSQNVMNNFISGLILLAERPIKINDLVQIDDLHGTVHRIGARSTQVRTSANIDMIVPNSAFLERNVINWTLSDNHVRTHVAVGVAYGSDVDAVTRLLLQSASEHKKVLSRPEDPAVLFQDFADNSLVFELHFWIYMRSQMERLKIESEIRYRIDKLFAEAGVVIAFPQRDVHLDADRPIAVRVLHGEASEA